MNDDNDFDRFNHQDYDNLGFRKTGNLFVYENEESSNIISRRYDDKRNYKSVDWRVTKGAIFMPIIFIAVIVGGSFFGLNKVSNDGAKKFTECMHKAEAHLKTKYNMNDAIISGHVSYKKNTQFCDLKVTSGDKGFNMIFDLNNSNSIYDSYQEETIMNYITKELSKYNTNVIGLEAHNDYLDNEKLSNNNYFKEYFNGDNLNKVLDGYTVNVFVDKELPEEVVRFASENSIDSINFIAMKDSDIYRGVFDIDSYSLNINKLIEIKNKQISKYKYDVINIEGINIVFKGHEYNLEEEPTMEKTLDGCYSIKYNGYKDPGDGIFRGNLLNIFSDKSTLININGTDYLTNTCPILSCKTKVGVPNGPIKVCLKQKDV